MTSAECSQNTRTCVGVCCASVWVILVVLGGGCVAGLCCTELKNPVLQNLPSNPSVEPISLFSQRCLFLTSCVLPGTGTVGACSECKRPSPILYKSADLVKKEVT